MIYNDRRPEGLQITFNPPYSVGQRSANDNAQNESYPQLEKRLANTYVAGTNATNKNALYDSYIKAFRWASDRLQRNGNNGGGIIGFVSNAGWLDGAAMDGMRACLEEEFSSIYIYNLRGNARTQGEQRRKEKDNVFGQGSRTPVSITILVKHPKVVNEKAEIFYRDIGDYLSREEKFDAINKLGKVTNDSKGWSVLKPNAQHDWLNKRSKVFPGLIAMGDKDDKNNLNTVFVPYYSNGLKTNRDAWIYNQSEKHLRGNIHRTIDFYNEQRIALEEGKIKELDMNPHKMAWVAYTVSDAERNVPYVFQDESIVESVYRPFFRSWAYYNRQMNQRLAQMPKIYPISNNQNLTICVPGLGVTKDFSVMMTNILTDLEFIGKSQCFEYSGPGGLFRYNP